MATQVWANVGLDIGTLGTAQTVSAITKANPGVMTYVGTDPANGDYLAVFASGMAKVDARVFRGANVSTAGNTIELESEDTSGYDTFSSGTMQPVTWSYSMATVRSVQSTGGEARTADDDTIHTDQGRQVKTGTNAHVITLTNKWAISDTALLALKAASDAGTQRAFRFRFADGSKLVGLASVHCPLIPTGSAGQVIECTVTLYVQGFVKAYTT